MGEGRGGVAWLNLNHQGPSAGLAFWWASCSHSSTHLHWNATTGRGEGRTMRRWASALVRVGCEWKAKAYLNTKEMRSVSRGPCPYSPIRAAILCFPPSMLWGSILNTKDLSTLFDQYMHFHHSALSVFTARLVAIKRLWFIPLSVLTALYCYTYCWCCFLYFAFFIFCA